MKAQVVKRLSHKYFIPNLPNYSVLGHLLYDIDADYLLRGFCFESSAFTRNRFTIYVFVQPLYVPSKFLHFTFGDRIGFISEGQDIWWEYDEMKESEQASEILSILIKYGLPYLNKRGSIKQFIQEFNKPLFLKNKHIAEAISYAYLLIGDYQKSYELLVTLKGFLSEDLMKYHEIEWMKDLNGRITLILDYIEKNEYENITKQLNEWKRYTLSNLGLIGKSDIL